MKQLTYVYCLVRAARTPVLRAASPGMPGGGAVRAIKADGDLWLIVSSVPEREYGEAALKKGLQNLDWVSRRAVAHEAVVEHFLTAPAMLPMQLFTLFTSDERTLEHVARQRAQINRILTRVRGNVEWGLRLTWDEQAARDRVERQHARGKTKARGGAGVAYLARKRDLLDVNKKQLAGAQRAATRLYRAMSREATDARRRTSTERAAPGSRLLLDAAFLVPSRGARAFRSALRRHSAPLEGSGIVVSLTGPWPAYNFISST